MERQSTDSGTVTARDCKAQIVGLHSLGGTARMGIAQISEFKEVHGTR